MKILYLISKYYHDCKMDMGRITHGRALAKREDVEFEFWGTGWPGYNDTAMLGDNLKATGREPDVLICYKPQDHTGVPECGVPAVLPFNDCYDEKTCDDLRGCMPRLVILHHENDFNRPWWRIVPRARFVHVPHCAERSIFCPIERGPRPVDVLVTGAHHPTSYPLRERFFHCVTSGRFADAGVAAQVRQFPGHRCPSAAETESQFRAYAAHLQRAKIVLVDSSRWHYALAKYVEAMAAGCLVIGDLPDDRRFCDSLGRYVVDIGHDADELHIVATVKQWLAKPDALRDTALAGQQAVLDGFTADHYAASLVEQIRMLRQ